ncbi:MAG: hypothetical protein K8R23_13525 [Chthoniobacter sp.]|nr:hypothetical protein [Chthoniobacter sp.]
MPVYNERVLLTGGVRFIESSKDVSYYAPEMKHPPQSVQSVRMDDGSLKFTWISFRGQPEKLMYLATGMHPVEIPSNIVRESKNLDCEIQIGNPFVLQGFGQSTAYVPDLIKLGDHISKRR